MLDLRPVERRPLSRAPLVLVIAQVRFSPTPALISGDTAATLRQALAETYPDAREERQELTITLPDGVPEHRSLSQWLLRDLDAEWTVTVAQDFIALHTTAYTDRGEFLGRLARVVDAVTVAERPAVVDRIGVRYVDRLVGQDSIAALPRLINVGLRGAVGDTGPGVVIHGQLTQTNARIDQDEVLIRSLVLPPNGLYDVMVQPIPEPAWVLDVDAFASDRRAFAEDDIAETAARLGDRVYSAFRWAVTDEFLGDHE